MPATAELVTEIVAGEPYEYSPLGAYVVRATGVCSGEPTFKYTRIRVKHAMDLIAGGRTVSQVAASYRVPEAAVQEAIDLSVRALIERG